MTYTDTALSDSAVTEGGWLEPVPLDAGETPTFPTDVLPEPGRKMVEHVADIVQCDPALPASCLLGVYALAIQRRATVRAQSQKEETALWIVPIAEVSERKSAAFHEILRPVFEFEAAEHKRMKTSIFKAKAKRSVIESSIEKLVKASGKKEDERDREQTTDKIQHLHFELDKTPDINPPRLIVDNVTEEKLTVLMEQNEERIAMVSAEPTLFQQMGGTRDRQSVLDIFLKAYSGELLRVDRMCRETVSLERPLLSVIITAQPGAVRDFMQVRRFEERGILSRFIFVPCEERAGTRLWSGKDWNPEIVRVYGDHIRTMLDNKEDRALELSPEALEIYIEHHNRVEIMQASGGEMEKNGWAGKQAGRALRIAANFHCAECHSSDKISADVMERAVKLSDFFIQAFLHVKEMVHETPELQKLRSLLKWMKAKKKALHTLRDIYRGLRRRFSDTKETRKYMDMLVENGDVRRYDDSKREAYMLNPYHRKHEKQVTNWDK